MFFCWRRIVDAANNVNMEIDGPESKYALLLLMVNEFRALKIGVLKPHFFYLFFFLMIVASIF